MDWDRQNVEHIARHAVQPVDVEEVVFEGKPLTTKGRNELYHVFGETQAGRYLLVVMALLGNQRARVITARDMTKRERQYYRKRR